MAKGGDTIILINDSMYESVFTKIFQITLLHTAKSFLFQS